MASVQSNSKILVITTRTKPIVINFESEEVHSLENDVKPFITNVKTVRTTTQCSNLDETVFLPCCDISKCGQWFVYCHIKKLFLWKTSDWSLVSTGNLERSPSKIRFSPSGSKIIVADKGGDVFVFARDNLNERGQLLLGHLSVLFDITITQDEKFIISCDRDEKIRVSCYPNSYNIYSFCLGHDEFVTSINILPHNQNILISTSGDRTIRFWDFKNGKELLKYPCSNDIDDKYFESDEEVSSIDSVAILKCESFQVSNTESVVCVILNNYKGCILYIIRESEKAITCEKLQQIVLEDIPCDIFISNNMLWVVSCKQNLQVCAFKWNKINSFESDVNSTVTILNKYLCNIEINFKSKISMLYKKQYDNVEEHHKRKSDKLNESVTKKNKILS